MSSNFVGACPGIIGVLDRHTTNKTHQKVMLCWTYENDLMVQYYDIEIQCKHHGEVLVSHAYAALLPLVLA